MNATLERPVKDDAEKALELLLAGLPPVDPFMKSKLRQAYLAGRTDEAEKNFDRLIKSMRKEQ